MGYFTTLDSYVKRYEECGHEYAFHAKSEEEYLEWKRALRTRLVEISGIGRSKKADPDLQLHEEVQDDGYLRSYYTVQTEPGIRMPFWMFTSQKPDGRVVLMPHGHGGGKETIRNWQWEFASGLLEKGYTVICPDMRGSGDRREYWAQGEGEENVRRNIHRDLMHLALGFGQCILGQAIWDLMRLIDVIVTMPGVNSNEIWCGGMSGGGQQTLWLTALDDRIKGALISGYFYGMKESLVKLPMNCACNFVPYIWETADMCDIAALIAPRPLFIESGEKDPLNGATGLENVYAQVEVTALAYKLFGAEERLVHSVHPGGHQWVAKGMLEFIEKYSN